MVDFYYSDCEIEKSNETTKRKSVLFGFSDVMIWSIEDRIKWLDTMSDRAGVLGCNWGNMKGANVMNSYRQILNECRDYLLLNLEDEHEPHFNLKDIDDELRINEDRIREYGSWKAKFTRIIERFNDKNTHVWDDTGYWKIEDMMKSSRNLVRLTAMHADYLGQILNIKMERIQKGDNSNSDF